MLSPLSPAFSSRHTPKSPRFSGDEASATGDETPSTEERKHTSKSHGKQGKRDQIAEKQQGKQDMFSRNRHSIPEEPDSDRPVKVERPEDEEYLKWCEEQKKAELLAIGQRFEVPGRLLNQLEEQGKALSRTVTNKAKTLATTVTDVACEKAVSGLKATAKAIEDWHTGR